jgi:hypothetical protein
MNQHLIAYYIGIFIIFASHIYMIYNPNQSLTTLQQHSYINIIGATLIAYYFLHKESYIKF